MTPARQSTGSVPTNASRPPETLSILGRCIISRASRLRCYLCSPPGSTNARPRYEVEIEDEGEEALGICAELSTLYRAAPDDLHFVPFTSGRPRPQPCRGIGIAKIRRKRHFKRQQDLHPVDQASGGEATETICVTVYKVKIKQKRTKKGSINWLSREKHNG